MKVLFIEPTPNPDALKFNVDERLVSGGYRSYESAEAAAADPLAAAVFAAGPIRSVFVMAEFVTVTIAPEGDWWTLKPKIQAAIDRSGAERQGGGSPSGEEIGPAGSARRDLPGADARLAQIMDLLAERVGPALAGDGGGLEVLGLEEDELRIRYHGACGSCPSAAAGTLRAIQEMLRIEVDPTLRVVPA
jgi:Fe-S cluster biogenesis protein NfuA